MTTPATPARAACARDRDGLRYAGDSQLTYADGSEAQLLALLKRCASVDSVSLEPLSLATSWAERYHTHPARAGVVRAFEIARDSVVLEVGAGCGGVTRYLGEIVDTVDALEPMPARALVARERTRDLAGVEVFVGEIADLPDLPAYDLVVVVGVLEYVGHGTADPQPYVDFLRAIRSRLKPGGSLVLAIENKFGVKYLAGAPEDHTSQVFDSIEGYPRGERARTFSRAELLKLMSDAGFSATTLGAFPDYKFTQSVFDLDALPDAAHSLLVDVPRFPSPDWAAHRPRLASERNIWKELVNAGLAPETPNSFIVLAGADGPSGLWPSDRVAVYSDVELKPEFAQTTVLRTAGDIRFTSTRHTPSSESADIVFDQAARPFVRGHGLAGVLATVGATERAALLKSFADLVLADTGAGSSLSTTAIVHPDSRVQLLPSTVRSTALDRTDALKRSILWLGLKAAAYSAPSHWPGATVARDVVAHFGALSFAEASTDWLSDTVAREAALQARLSVEFAGGDAENLWRDKLDTLLSRELAQGELGIRDYEVVAPLREQNTELTLKYRASQDLLAEAQREVERLRVLLGARAD